MNCWAQKYLGTHPVDGRCFIRAWWAGRHLEWQLLPSSYKCTGFMGRGPLRGASGPWHLDVGRSFGSRVAGAGSGSITSHNWGIRQRSEPFGGQVRGSCFLNWCNKMIDEHVFLMLWLMVVCWFKCRYHHVHIQIHTGLICHLLQERISSIIMVINQVIGQGIGHMLMFIIKWLLFNIETIEMEKISQLGNWFVFFC